MLTHNVHGEEKGVFSWPTRRLGKLMGVRDEWLEFFDQQALQTFWDGRYKSYWSEVFYFTGGFWFRYRFDVSLFPLVREDTFWYAGVE